VNKTILTATGLGNGDPGLTRAESDEAGNWTVEFLLEGQEVRCLATDPNNSDVVFAGTQGDGVVFSTDRGRSWQPGGLEGQTVKSIAVSPHKPGTIYAGTRPAAFGFDTTDSSMGARHAIPQTDAMGT